jgi:predicted PurR-regulated permease PerM
VQIIDNILVPVIINTKVKIMPLYLLLELLLRSECGIGNVFAIPILAIVKIIFDKIDSLEPWGYLMGDNLPRNSFGDKKRKPKPQESEQENIE